MGGVCLPRHPSESKRVAARRIGPDPPKVETRVNTRGRALEADRKREQIMDLRLHSHSHPQSHLHAERSPAIEAPADSAKPPFVPTPISGVLRHFGAFENN